MIARAPAAMEPEGQQQQQPAAVIEQQQKGVDAGGATKQLNLTRQCQVRTCEQTCQFVAKRSIQLCKGHGNTKEAMLAQAAKAGCVGSMNLREYLESLETSEPDAFLERLMDFEVKFLGNSVLVVHPHCHIFFKFNLIGLYYINGTVWFWGLCLAWFVVLQSGLLGALVWNGGMWCYDILWVCVVPRFFCILPRSPPTKKGKARIQYDFSVLKKSLSTGSRSESRQVS